ncbi:MAG: heat-inducible transcription repressor HrcA [Magnetococcales bacterium]|nr:heat-inducible transcription repressor HrcA [Magnetococcales bacterium]
MARLGVPAHFLLACVGMLTKRHHEILRLVVHAHMEGGEPVGSKTITERSQLGVSSATVRNAMVELEEMGLLTQPHASAGRVPTDLGFRFYVDSLLEVAALSREEQARIIRVCEQGSEDLETVLARVSQVLATMTMNACMVRTPDVRHAVLRRVQFIKLTGRSGLDRILALLISDSGQLRSRVFYLESNPSQEKLDRFGLLLSRQLEGMTLSEVREHLQHEVEQSEQEYRMLCGNLLESVTGSFVGGGLIVNGRMNVFRSFMDLAHIQEMLAVLEEKKGLVHLLDKCLDLEGVRLFIGAEAEVSRTGCAVVAAPFKGADGSYPGTLGVLGSTRMDYAHVIPLVGFTTKVLSTLFSDGTVSGSVCLSADGCADRGSVDRGEKAT